MLKVSLLIFVIFDRRCQCERFEWINSATLSEIVLLAVGQRGSLDHLFGYFIGGIDSIFIMHLSGSSEPFLLLNVGDEEVFTTFRILIHLKFLVF